MSANPNYVGEFPIDVANHPLYSKYKREDWAMYFITAYGQIDGAHHKNWVLDQVARVLRGTPVLVHVARWDNDYEEDRMSTGEPSEEYLAWVEEMRGATDVDGDREYDYDEGIAP